MATIKWASSVSGSWSNAADWTGRVVPGAGDTAVIDSPGTTNFTVDVTSSINVSAINLNSLHGKLQLDSSASFETLALTKGTLILDDGSSLSGTIVNSDKLTYVDIETGRVALANVTWEGLLSPTLHDGTQATLTISHGLTLTGAGGTGTGTADFGLPIILDNVASLDNANVTTYNVTLENTPTLTLGSDFMLDSQGTGSFDLTGGDALVNGGTITGAIEVAGATTQFGVFINNGTIDGGLGTNNVSFTNNGTINVGRGYGVALSLDELNASGAHAAINIDGGVFGVIGTLTTKQFEALYIKQHVSLSGTYGFAVNGELKNAGHTLAVGTGTALGIATYTGNGATLIDGGMVVDHGGGDSYSLKDATLTSTSPTLALSLGELNSSTVTGVRTLDFTGGLSLEKTTLDGIGTLAYTGTSQTSLVLDGVTFTDLAASASPVIDISEDNEADPSGLELEKAVGAITFNVNNVFVSVNDGITLKDSTFNVSGRSHLTNLGSLGLAFGAKFVDTIAPAASEDVGNSGGSHIVNDGVFNVAGDLAFSFEDAVPSPTLSGDGTINLQGSSSTNAELDVGVSVEAGQIVAFQSGPGLVVFEAPDYATNFLGTLSGFAIGDSLHFIGDTLSSAKFAGHSIVVNLSNGSTISLTTSKAESGSLTATNSGGNGLVSFASASSADWNVSAAGQQTRAAVSHVEVAASATHTPFLDLVGIHLHAWM